MELGGCPCCVLPAAAIVCLLAWVVGSGLQRWLVPRSDGSTVKRLVFGGLRCASTLGAVGVAAIAVVVGILASSPDLQARAFAQLCETMTAGPELDAEKCATLGGATGRVLELGPGPAVSFRCFANRTDGAISEWVGAEPNAHFQAAIDAARERFALPFATSLVWMKGEDLDVAPASFDSVVGTHVLCSVGDVQSVLAQVSRALRPGGSYSFLEHVEDPQRRPHLRLLQRLAGPLLNVVGNGCHIRPLWEELEHAREAGLFSSVDLQHSDFTQMPLPFLWPHITGVATR